MEDPGLGQEMLHQLAPVMDTRKLRNVPVPWMVKYDLERRRRFQQVMRAVIDKDIACDEVLAMREDQVGLAENGKILPDPEVFILIGVMLARRYEHNVVISCQLFNPLDRPFFCREMPEEARLLVDFLEYHA